MSRPAVPGAIRSNNFVRPFSFTVPADWYNLDAINTQYQLHRYGDPANQQLIVYYEPEIASQAAGCPPAAEPGRSGTVTDWIDFLTTHPGLAASTPRDVSVGGLTGTLIDIRIADGWSRPCPWSRDVPYVNYLTGIYWPFEGWGLGGDARARLVFVEPPQGGTVLIEIDANSGGAFDEFVAAAMPIVESITFAD